MAKISYVDFTPEKEAVMRGLIEPMRPLLPSWLRELVLFNKREYCEEGDSYAATMDVSLSYLTAKMRIYLAFWEGEDREDRERLIRHELCHIIAAPSEKAAEDILNAAFPEQSGPAYAFMRKRLTEAQESVVQEMAYILNPEGASK